MNKLNTKDWNDYLRDSLSALLSMEPVLYEKLAPSHLPELPGIYIISEYVNNEEIALYIGRTKNIRRRIYVNHLMGSITNARLKKYMTSDPEHLCYDNVPAAKLYLRENCRVRWIVETEMRKRGALEGYLTGMIFPKYGISEEH